MTKQRATPQRAKMMKASSRLIEARARLAKAEAEAAEAAVEPMQPVRVYNAASALLRATRGYQNALAAFEQADDAAKGN